MAVKTFTTGEVLTAADTNTYLANSGLVYVTSATIGTTVASVSLNDCFSSTYDNYKIVVEIGDTSGAMSLYWRWRVGGTDNTTTDYQWFYSGHTNAGGTISSASAGQTYAFCGLYTSASGVSPIITLDVMRPFVAKETRVYNFGYYRATASVYYGGNSHNGGTSFDGFTIYPSAGTMTGGTITVYGYRKA